MTTIRRVVDGDPVKLIVLPKFTPKAVAAFKEFVMNAPDGILGLDVETTAIPQFEDARKSFNPAIYRAQYTVPTALPEKHRKKFTDLGYEPGTVREMTVRTVQFGSHTVAWVLPAEGPWLKGIRWALNQESIRYVSHNAAFDATRVDLNLGVSLGDRSIDTLPMASLIWPGRLSPAGFAKGKGLKEISNVLIDTGLKEAEEILHARFADLYFARTVKLPKTFVPGESPCRRTVSKSNPACGDEHGRNASWEDSLCGFCSECWLARKPDDKVTTWGWDNIPIDDPYFTAYAGLDAIYVRRLLDLLSESIAEMGMKRLSRTEQHVKRYMTATSMRGHRVDIEWTQSLLDDTEAVYGGAISTIGDITSLKPRSPYLRSWLAENDVKTKSLDKEHLPDLIQRYGDEEKYGEVAVVLKALGVYAENSNMIANLTTILRHAEGGSGFTHSALNTLQAHTGRMSATGPAMQTFKKGDKRLRGCYIAREGYVLVGADYDSQEIRIGAGLSGDEMLLKIILEGLNQHVLTAESLFPDVWVSKDKCPREYAAAKTLDFAQQYGAGPKKIALQLGVSVAEATAMWRTWRHTYRGLVRWNDHVGKQPYVTNPYGRRIPRDLYRSYANGNYLIQSTGRDILGESMLRLAAEGWDRYFWLPVHDELVLEVPEVKAEEAADALTRLMTTDLHGYNVKVQVPIPAEGEIIGQRWGGLALAA